MDPQPVVPSGLHPGASYFEGQFETHHMMRFRQAVGGGSGRAVDRSNRSSSGGARRPGSKTHIAPTRGLGAHIFGRIFSWPNLGPMGGRLHCLGILVMATSRGTRHTRALLVSLGRDSEEVVWGRCAGLVPQVSLSSSCSPAGRARTRSTRRARSARPSGRCALPLAIVPLFIIAPARSDIVFEAARERRASQVHASTLDAATAPKSHDPKVPKFARGHPDLVRTSPQDWSSPIFGRASPTEWSKQLRIVSKPT